MVARSVRESVPILRSAQKEKEMTEQFRRTELRASELHMLFSVEHFVAKISEEIQLLAQPHPDRWHTEQTDYGSSDHVSTDA